MSDNLTLVLIGVFSLFCVLLVMNYFKMRACEKKLAVFSEIVIQVKCEFTRLRINIASFLADLTSIETSLEIVAARIAGMTGLGGIRTMTALVEQTLLNTFAFIRKHEPVFSAFGAAEQLLAQEARMLGLDLQPNNIVATIEKKTKKPAE